MKALNLSRARDEHNVLKNLSSLKHIIIQKSDKRNSIVLMNRDDYINRMETLYQIQSIFKNSRYQKTRITTTLRLKKKRLVDNVLDTLHEKNATTPDTKTILTPDGPSSARLYGIPKIHKALMVFQNIDQLYLKFQNNY